MRNFRSTLHCICRSPKMTKLYIILKKKNNKLSFIKTCVCLWLDVYKHYKLPFYHTGTNEYTIYSIHQYYTSNVVNAMVHFACLRRKSRLEFLEKSLCYSIFRRE